MNKHYEISYKKLLERYNTAKRRGNDSKEFAIGRSTKIDIFSNDEIEVYFDTTDIWGVGVWDCYTIYHNKRKNYVHAYRTDIEPKSIREKLHNIQENKKHEQALRD